MECCWRSSAHAQPASPCRRAEEPSGPPLFCPTEHTSICADEIHSSPPFLYYPGRVETRCEHCGFPDKHQSVSGCIPAVGKESRSPPVSPKKGSVRCLRAVTVSAVTCFRSSGTENLTCHSFQVLENDLGPRRVSPQHTCTFFGVGSHGSGSTFTVWKIQSHLNLDRI